MAQLKAPVAADETAVAADIVMRFLVASMVPDPQTAALYISDELKITFTGGRKYSHPRETAAFNGKRYKLVKKKMERTDVVPGNGETIVYNLGTLYGEWPDGTPFEGNRYVDRFVVRGGKYECPEGQSRSRNVVIEFPDYATAVACYRSPEYQANLKIRQANAITDLIIVEGYDGPQP